MKTFNDLYSYIVIIKYQMKKALNYTLIALFIANTHITLTLIHPSTQTYNILLKFCFISNQTTYLLPEEISFCLITLLNPFHVLV